MATQELARPSIGGTNNALGATNPETLTTWLLNSQVCVYV